MTSAASHTRSTCLAVLSLAALLGLAATASAAPTITSFKIEAIPIAGFPHTGNILGAGAVIQGHTSISGTEYGGSPPPLIGIRFYAPAGTTLHPQGFATCATNVVESSGPEACPKRSLAGPAGSVLGTVTFGRDRVPATATVQPFFAPGGPEAFVRCATPTLVEILVKAHILSASPPYGVEIIGEIPLIETVPGALDASVEEGTIKVGAAFNRGKQTVSYITMPTKCPKGGLPVKEELSFLGGGHAEASSKVQCPRK
jgi:hypothetical protein